MGHRRGGVRAGEMGHRRGGVRAGEMGQLRIHHHQVGAQPGQAAGRLGRGQQRVDARGDRADAGRSEVDGRVVDVGPQHQADHRALAQPPLVQPGRNLPSGLLELLEAQGPARRGDEGRSMAELARSPSQGFGQHPTGYPTST